MTTIVFPLAGQTRSELARELLALADDRNQVAATSSGGFRVPDGLAEEWVNQRAAETTDGASDGASDGDTPQTSPEAPATTPTSPEAPATTPTSPQLTEAVKDVETASGLHRSKAAAGRPRKTKE